MSALINTQGFIVRVEQRRCLFPTTAVASRPLHSVFSCERRGETLLCSPDRGGEKGTETENGERHPQHGAESTASAAATGANGAPSGPHSMPEWRRGPEPGQRVQDEECHRVGAAFSEGERPQHHAQPVGLRAQTAVLRQERLPR